MASETLTANASIRIHKPATEVFAAFTNAAQMSKFWFTRQDDGLKQGASITWYLGAGKDAYAFEVFVRELRSPNLIVIEWENGGATTQVMWTIEEIDDANCILAIEESGYAGTGEEMTDRALDSTGGFNQVVVAAKALIEHGIAINVVADHA